MRKAERINGEKDRIGAERGGVTSLRIGILDVECGPSRGPWLEFIAGLSASTEKLPLQISRRIDLPSIRVFLFFLIEKNTVWNTMQNFIKYRDEERIRKSKRKNRKETIMKWRISNEEANWEANRRRENEEEEEISRGMVDRSTQCTQCRGEI